MVPDGAVPAAGACPASGTCPAAPVVRAQVPHYCTGGRDTGAFPPTTAHTVAHPVGHARLARARGRSRGGGAAPLPRTGDVDGDQDAADPRARRPGGSGAPSPLVPVPIVEGVV